MLPKVTSCTRLGVEEYGCADVFYFGYKDNTASTSNKYEGPHHCNNGVVHHQIHSLNDNK